MVSTPQRGLASRLRCLPAHAQSSNLSRPPLPRAAALAHSNELLRIPALLPLLSALENVLAPRAQFLLKNLAGIKGSGFSVPAMIKRLVVTSLTPLVAGKALISASPTAATWAQHTAKLLTYISSAVIVFQPWVTISRSTKKSGPAPWPPSFACENFRELDLQLRRAPPALFVLKTVNQKAK